ncbi:MAG: hypothetical protein ACRDWX_03240 [Acidimicrobiia bacterium]
MAESQVVAFAAEMSSRTLTELPPPVAAVEDGGRLQPRPLVAV